MMKREMTVAAVAMMSILATPALAQQPAPKAAPAAKAAAPAPAAAGAPQSAWVKLCEKAPFVGKDKDGKDVRADKSICLTHHERLDATTGMVLVSAAIREIEGAEKKHLMVMLPLGMAIPPGLQIGVYNKDMWDKINKGEKVDDSALKPIKLGYTLCHSAGCTAEVEASDDIMKEVGGGEGMIIYAVSGNGGPIAFPVPLTGFGASIKGPAADGDEYGKKRRQLMQEIEKNRMAAMEEFKKQNEQLQKMQGGAAHGTGAPAKAAPAATAPAPKKP